VRNPATVIDSGQSPPAGQPDPAPHPAAGPDGYPATGPGDRPAAGGQRHRGWAARLGAGGRRGRMAWAAAAAVLAVIVVVSVTGGKAGARPQPPPAAKGFSLKMLGHPGSQISLAGYAGRPVIVNFFASWCPPCKRETPLIARFYRDARGTVAIIGVDANDEAGPAEQFLRQSGVTYPVGFDPFPASTTVSYGVYQLPQTFFLNARHRIVKHVFGPLTLKQLSADVAAMDGRPATPAGAQAQGQGRSQDRG